MAVRIPISDFARSLFPGKEGLDAYLFAYHHEGVRQHDEVRTRDLAKLNIEMRYPGKNVVIYKFSNYRKRDRSDFFGGRQHECWIDVEYIVFNE